MRSLTAGGLVGPTGVVVVIVGVVVAVGVVATGALGSLGGDGSSYGNATSAYADEHDLSSDQAKEELEAQTRLADFGETARRSLEGFAGFKTERHESGPVGFLAVVGGDDSAVVVPDGLPVRVVSARFGAGEVEKVWSQRQGLPKEIRDEVVSVKYDPFTDKVVLWTLADPIDLDEPTRTEIDRFVTTAFGEGHEYRKVAEGTFD